MVEELKNYRPISLLCVDYKIIARALSNRLKFCMSTIISPDQTCCVPGRNITNNIRSISDVITYCEDRDEEGYILTVDQEKAFDRVSHDFIIKVLEKFSFGNSFCKWIRLLYNGISSSVKVNGHLTPKFSVTRSVRQGCPLSAMLYVLISEPMNLMIHANTLITGIQVNSGCTSLVYQHADDTTVTVANADSVNEAFTTINYFCDATGAKVNKDKCELLLLSKAKQNSNIFPVATSTECIKILGVYVGPNQKMCSQLNWSEKLAKSNSLLQLWKARKLSLQGKSIVVNSLLLTKFWYLFSCVDIPDVIEQKLTFMCRNFMWPRSQAIKSTTMLGEKDQGGLNIPDIKLKKYSFRLKILKQLDDNNGDFVWKHTMQYFLGKYINMGLFKNIFSIIYHKESLNVLPKFYIEVLYAWHELTDGHRPCVNSLREILQQPIFHNPHVKHNGDVLLYKDYVDAGIVVIGDICYEAIPGFLSADVIHMVLNENGNGSTLQTVKDKNTVIINALPEVWRTEIRGGTVQQNTGNEEIVCRVNDSLKSSSELTVKYTYSVLKDKYFVEPTSYSHYAHYWDDITWQQIWKAIYINDKSSEQTELDFKIAHNIVYTKEKLYKCKLVDSDLCSLCNNNVESIMHMFVLCPNISELVHIVENIFTDLLLDKGFTLCEFQQWLVLGFPKGKCCFYKFANVVLSIYRISVFKRRQVLMQTGHTIHIVRLFKAMLHKHFRYLHGYYNTRGKLLYFCTHYVFCNNYVTLNNNGLVFAYPLK